MNDTGRRLMTAIFGKQEIEPTTGVYSSGQIPWMWVGDDYIDPLYDQLYDERRQELIEGVLAAAGFAPYGYEAPPTDDEIEDLIAADLQAEFDYWEGGTDQLYGDWLQDDDGLYYPDPDGEFALYYDSNDGCGQLVFSKWVRYGRPASPCFPGQVDAREDDLFEPDGEPQYASPTEQIFCQSPNRRCVPYYSFPQEAFSL